MTTSGASSQPHSISHADRHRKSVAMDLLRLLQLTDSGFPTGGYAYSHGLEGMHAMGLVHDEGDVRAFALAHLHETLGRQELPAAAHAHQAATQSELGALVTLDLLLDALKPVPAFRIASTRIGRQFLHSALPLCPSAIGERYLAAVTEGEGAGHHAVAFGAITATAGIDLRNAVTGLAFASLASYVAAAVRLGVIGQGAAQRIVSSLEPALVAAIDTAPQIPLADLGSYTPLIDIAGMRQPQLATRMFSS